MKRELKYLLFLLIPAVVYLLVFKLREAWGEYYLNPNCDPAYLYLINSLNVATLHSVNHVDNPGATVQVLGGIIIRILALVRGAKDIEADVFQNPEYYLVAINRVLFSLNLLVFAVLGVVSFRLTKNFLLSVLLQCAPLGSWLLIKSMLMVGPEPMMVFTGCIFTLLLVWITEREVHVKKTGLLALLFSLATAFGIATKLIFIPFVFIPLTILPGYKWKAVFLLLTVGIFHLFLLPAFAHYDYFLDWVKRLTVHSGKYGMGQQEFINAPEASVNLLKLLALEHLFYLAVFFGGLMWLFIVLNKKRRAELANKPAVQLLPGILLTVMFQLLLTAKHYHPRYAIPSLTLFPFVIYLNVKVFNLISGRYKFPVEIFRCVQIKTGAVIIVSCLFFMRHYMGYFPGDDYADWVKTIHASGIGYWLANTYLMHLPLLLAFIFLFLMALAVMRFWAKWSLQKTNGALSVCLAVLLVAYQLRQTDIAGFYRQCANLKQEEIAISGVIEKQYKDYGKIYSIRASSKIYALKFGTIFNFSKQSQLVKMQELYPGKIYFVGMKKDRTAFETWTEAITLPEILALDSNLVLYGGIPSLTPKDIQQIESQNRVKLVNVFQGKWEVIYLIKKAG